MKSKDTCNNELISSYLEAGFFQDECETKVSIYGLKKPH